jgi:hypothetical protein
MKSIFKNSIIVAALLFGAASVSNAQVKVGANPASIGTTSNLEVEAANGNKTIVDKATGQVTIQDGTQGVNKVLTSDANGASSWMPATSVLNPEVLLSATNTTGQAIPANVRTTLNFTNKLFDVGNNFTLPSTFVAPTTGKYTITILTHGGTSSTQSARITGYTVRNSLNQLISKALDFIVIPAGVAKITTVTTTIALNAGEQVTIDVTSDTPYTVLGADVQITKVGN